MRAVPASPVPFSTPRAWASLSQALDLAEQGGILDKATRRALTFGRVSAEDAAIFCAMAEEKMDNLLPLADYIADPGKLPQEHTTLWFILSLIRKQVATGEWNGYSPEKLNSFLLALPREHRFALLTGMVQNWGALGVEEALLQSLREVTGLPY